MDTFYSGHFPFVEKGRKKTCRPRFDVVKFEVNTEDYRLTGVTDRQHFQAVTIKLMLKKLACIAGVMFLDPFVIHRLRIMCLQRLVPLNSLRLRRDCD